MSLRAIVVEFASPTGDRVTATIFSDVWVRCSDVRLQRECERLLAAARDRALSQPDFIINVANQFAELVDGEIVSRVPRPPTDDGLIH